MSEIPKPQQPVDENGDDSGIAFPLGSRPDAPNCKTPSGEEHYFDPHINELGDLEERQWAENIMSKIEGLPEINSASDIERYLLVFDEIITGFEVKSSLSVSSNFLDDGSQIFSLLLSRFKSGLKKRPELLHTVSQRLADFCCHYHIMPESAYEINRNLINVDYSNTSPWFLITTVEKRDTTEHAAVYVPKNIIKSLSDIDNSESTIYSITSSYIEQQNNAETKIHKQFPPPIDVSSTIWLDFFTRSQSDAFTNDEERAETYNFFHPSVIHTAQEELLDETISVLREIGTPEAAKYILKLAEEVKSGNLIKPIADSLTEIADVSQSTKMLLERIENEDIGEAEKKYLLRLLFRLELGKIGLSEDGLDYLGRRFNLGEFNDSANFAQRLTPDGKVGIFDADRNLSGLVQLESEDFESERTGDETRAISKEVLGITCEMLFTPRPDESEEERAQREKILEEFKANYFDTYIGMFSEQSDLRFNNLNLPEQGWVLRYLHTANEEERTKFFAFIEQFGEDGFRAFRSMEFGPEMAEDILKIAQQMDPESAKLVFNKYSELIATSRETATFVHQNTQNVETSDEEIQKITLHLLERGKEIIASFASNPGDNDEMIKKLSDARADIILFAETFKTMKEGKAELSLEDFQKFKSEIIPTDELSEDDKVEMIHIMEQNYSASGDNNESQTLSKLKPMVLSSLSDALSSPKTKFQIVRYDNRIIGFMRFDQQENDTVHAGSFNIRSFIRGSKIGSAALEATLDQRAATQVIVAEASPRLSITTRYIGPRFGFVATDIVEAEGTGEVGFEMVRDDKVNPRYKGFTTAPQNPINLVEAENTQFDQDVVAVSFDPEQEYETFVAFAKKMFENHVYVLTSYPREGSRQQATFERKLETTGIAA